MTSCREFPWFGLFMNKLAADAVLDSETCRDPRCGEPRDMQTFPTLIFAKQDAYVTKVVDAVNDLDDVLYEISNESGV